MANGDVGAPRIRTAAMQPPTAGATSIIMRLQEAEVTTTEGAYPDAGLHNRHSSEQHLGVTCLVAGTVTVYAEHKTSGTTPESSVRVLKNEVEVVEWTEAFSTFAAKQVDVAVAVGDALILQQRVSGGTDSTWRNLRIYSNTPDMAVA